MEYGKIPLGIVVERKDSSNPWIEYSWSTVDVLPGAPSVVEWKRLSQGGGWERYHAATLTLELFKGETEGYRYNLTQEEPKIYVVLRQGEEAGEADIVPFLATACPHEAMGYGESGDEIVDGVPMPAKLISWVQGFVDQYHVDEPFKKRKNKRYDPNDPRHGPRPRIEY
jgi:hypothetical protein